MLNSTLQGWRGYLGDGGEVFYVVIYNSHPNSVLKLKGIICIYITLTEDFQTINPRCQLMPTWSISFFSIDNLTCKLPRMFQSTQSDLFLNPENTTRGECRKQGCSSVQRDDSRDVMLQRKDELVRFGITEEWAELLRGWCFPPMPLPFFKELQCLKADKLC